MERWCYQVLLVLCLGCVMWNDVVKADNDQNFKDHCCTYFRGLDYDGDLTLTELDFINLTKAIVTIDIALNPLDEADKMLEVGVQVFSFFPLMDATTFELATISNGVTLKAFLTSMTTRRCTPVLKQDVTDLVNFIHSIFNADGNDKKLTKRELGHMYQVFRIGSSLDAGFSSLDYDVDDFIEVSEGNTDAQLYFCEAPPDDLIPTRSYFGSVIACETLVNGDLSKLP